VIPIIEASCAGVGPVLSITIKSSFLLTSADTMQAFKLPWIAAQWRRNAYINPSS